MVQVTAMINYNKFLEKTILPFADRINGSNFIGQLNGLKQIYSYNESDVRKLQKEKLKKLLEHATKNCPYYRDLSIYKDLDSEKWLKKFPIIDKMNLKEHTDQLLTKEKNKLIEQRSSGSSGRLSIVYQSPKEVSLTYAIHALMWEWAGYKLGDPLLQTGIAPQRGFKKKIKDLLLNVNYLQAFIHSKQEAEHALKWALQKNKPVMAGYASSLYVLAEYSKKMQQVPKFQTVISFGDKLFDHYRKTIQEQFQCNVYETYGTAEGFKIAAQKDLPWMYIMSPNVYLEILDEEGNEVPDGNMGHVVVTNLDNYSMPLIRYKIGDLAIKMPKEKYPQQRQLALPLLKKVIGRDTDLIKTKSGKYMIVHSFTGIFEHIQEIKQFQIVQNDLNGIIIKYIPNGGFNANLLKHIEEKIQKYLDEPSFRIDFERVNHIEPSGSGKPQIIKSNLQNY